MDQVIYVESMITLGDEDDLLDDIKEGVEIAMQRRGYNSGNIDPIKFNKLTYLAIHEYDIPITYGWYKYGPAPANVAHQSITVRPRALNEVPAVKDVKPIDPTGAGDAFRSGLIKGLCLNKELQEAAKMGATCASFCVEHKGTQEHKFTWDQFWDRYRANF